MQGAAKQIHHWGCPRDVSSPIIFDWLQVAVSNTTGSSNAGIHANVPERATRTAADRLSRASAGGQEHSKLKSNASSSGFNGGLTVCPSRVSDMTKPPTSNVMGRKGRFPEGTCVWYDALVADETRNTKPIRTLLVLSPQPHRRSIGCHKTHKMSIAALPRNHS